jgi:hypothetical protein
VKAAARVKLRGFQLQGKNGDLPGRVIGDASEQVGEVVLRVDAVARRPPASEPAGKQVNSCGRS